MALPENMPNSLEAALTSDSLLDKTLASSVVSDMDSGKAIQWNLILNKQLELEKGGADEAHD
jgi:hypothetical protein